MHLVTVDVTGTYKAALRDTLGAVYNYLYITLHATASTQAIYNIFSKRKNTLTVLLLMYICRCAREQVRDALLPASYLISLVTHASGTLCKMP